jgi:hypothetical protein
LAFRPHITVTSTGLVVQSPIQRANMKFADILWVRPGYYGLLIRTRDGRVVSAWAVQKSNAARWAKKRTRADDVADAIISRMPVKEQG